MPRPPGATGTGRGGRCERRRPGTSAWAGSRIWPSPGRVVRVAAELPRRRLPPAGGSREGRKGGGGGESATGRDGAAERDRDRGGGSRLRPAGGVRAPLPPSRRLSPGSEQRRRPAEPGRAGLPGKGDTLQLLRLQMQTHPIDSSEVTSAYNRAKFGCGVDGIKAHVSE